MNESYSYFTSLPALDFISFVFVSNHSNRHIFISLSGFNLHSLIANGASQVALVVKSPPNAGNIKYAGSVPGLRRFPGGGHGNPLQYSCLENPHGQTNDLLFSCAYLPSI